LPWFIKQETFLRPYAEMQPHLAAHRAWVEELRAEGVVISSGYLVDGEGRPGGGGLLLLQAADYATAEALVRRSHSWLQMEGCAVAPERNDRPRHGVDPTAPRA
jgi:uncharacterized protein YciI